MSKSDYYEIGAIMHRKNGKAYEVVKGGCYDCAFAEKSFDWCYTINCASFDRADGNDVAFRRRKDLDSDKINPNMVTVPTDKLKEMQLENARLSAQVEKFDETLSKSITETGRDVMRELVSKLDSLDDEDFFGPFGWRDFLDMKNSGL